MKTAVSVPDDLFAQVDRLAKRSRRSRSEVYSAALREYVARHAPDEVTVGLDAVLAELGQPDAGEFTNMAARRTLEFVRVVIAQGEVWWAGLGDPAGSEPGYRRPVVVVQGDAFNASSLRTVVCVVLTSNTRWAEAPGNVLLIARATGLPKASVANVSQLVTLDRTALTLRAGRLSASNLELVLTGIDVVLGRA